MPSPAELAKQLQQAAAVLAPDNIARLVGVRAVQQAQDALETEGETIGENWQDRIEGTPDNNRRLLLQRGNMYNAIRYRAAAGTVYIGVDGAAVPYAQIHNEGGKIAVTPKMRKYFWAKYYENANRAAKKADSTRDSDIRKYAKDNATAEFWKRLALTKKTAFDIPKRTFLQPDTAKLRTQVSRDIDEALTRILRP